MFLDGHSLLVHHKPHRSHTLYLAPHAFMLPGWPRRHLSLQHLLCCFLSFSSSPDSQMLLVKCFFILLQNSPVKNGLSFPGKMNGLWSSVSLWKDSWPQSTSFQYCCISLNQNSEGHFPDGRRGLCAQEASVVTPVHTSSLVCVFWGFVF